MVSEFASKPKFDNLRKKAEKKAALLNKLLEYLETKPSSEFIQRDIDIVFSKINRRVDEEKNLKHIVQGGEKELKSAKALLNAQVKELKEQLKVLRMANY